MNKTDLINAVAEKSELSKKDSTSAVEATIEAITESLANGEKVSLKGFGNFEVRERAARNGRNPSTGESIRIEHGGVSTLHPLNTRREISVNNKTS